MNRKNKLRVFQLSSTWILMIITIVFIVINISAIINYMVEYKYNIDENFDKSDIVMSLNSRDTEISAILFYLKALIAYFFVVIGYLWYRIDVNRSERKQTLDMSDSE
jgi:hypothetical protein